MSKLIIVTYDNKRDEAMAINNVWSSVAYKTIAVTRSVNDITCLISIHDTIVLVDSMVSSRQEAETCVQTLLSALREGAATVYALIIAGGGIHHSLRNVPVISHTDLLRGSLSYEAA